MTKKSVMSIAVVAALVSLLAASPAAAISPSFFQNYVSVGALVVRTANPGGAALVAVNFRPADLTPADANTLYVALRSTVTGGTIDSFTPAQIAAAGIAPVQVIQAMQQVFVADLSFSEFYLLDVYRRPPSGFGIDLYRWFGPNDFRYTITFQF